MEKKSLYNKVVVNDTVGICGCFDRVDLYLSLPGTWGMKSEKNRRKKLESSGTIF